MNASQNYLTAEHLEHYGNPEVKSNQVNDLHYAQNL